MYIMNVKLNGKCSFSESTKNNDSKLIISYVGPSSDGMNSVFGYFYGNNDFKNLYKDDFTRINIMNGKNFNTFNGIKRGHHIMSTIFSNNAIPLFPFFSFNGRENYFMLIYDKMSYDNILDAIKTKNNIISSEYIKINSGEGIFDVTKRLYSIMKMYNITGIEIKILKDAIYKGYFEWPRNYNLDNISKEFNLSKPTILFHLRNAEKKILTSMIE